MALWSQVNSKFAHGNRRKFLEGRGTVGKCIGNTDVTGNVSDKRGAGIVTASKVLEVGDGGFRQHRCQTRSHP